MLNTTSIYLISEWEECYDSKSGFPYYWNTKTNVVTWEKPTNFVIRSSINGPIPNIPELQNKVKIYKIAATQPSKSNGASLKVQAKKVPQKKNRQSDSDDE